MKARVLLSACAALSWHLATSYGDTYDMPLIQKVRSLPVVAEVRIERVKVRPDLPNTLQDLLCDCEILQGFKIPFATNKITFRLNFAALPEKYTGKKAIVFAFKSDDGHFSPYGGHLGFILESESYYDRFSHTNISHISYSRLLRELRGIVEANKNGAANRSQPVQLGTNSTPLPAGSAR